MKFLYYLASIGNPDLQIKMNILFDNLNYIYKYHKYKFDIIINCYETDVNIYTKIRDKVLRLSFINNCYLYVKRGVLTELFLTNEYNHLVYNYDYIMFILDDVKIIDIDLNEMIRIKNTLNIGVLSPRIVNSTHAFMNIYNGITINNCLEVFLLLLSPYDFDHFLSIYTVENKWMWGCDFLFGYYNIRAGVINKYSAHHILSSKSDKSIANNLMLSYLVKKTSFKNLNDILQKYNPVIQEYK
jgi:hypothetical protein